MKCICIDEWKRVMDWTKLYIPPLKHKKNYLPWHFIHGVWYNARELLEETCHTTLLKSDVVASEMWLVLMPHIHSSLNFKVFLSMMNNFSSTPSRFQHRKIFYNINILYWKKIKLVKDKSDPVSILY